ncbi:glycosyltransferase [Rhodococcus sp. KRD162]|uniref:glycosyltransferase n=1 Tax=Rhodococcus sp. KRD162 TaxID=2729725 RepID=UPI0019D1997B|nr:glycosyltransferase [Rhodococcus sp. KRD162]
MRILHVVTLISEDGAYGGPTRVALNQAGALADLGHEVTVVAAGLGPPPKSGSVQIELFTPRRLIPRSGFAGLSAPGMLRWLAGAAERFDVAHVHLARDLVTLPAARLCRLRGLATVVQTHGMIDASGKLLAKPLDALVTRSALRRAAAVFYLTDRERSDLIDVAGPRMKLVNVINGVPTLPEKASDRGLEVLFLARLHPRKRADLFVDMAEVIVHEHDSVTCALVGPDAGAGDAIAKRTGPRIRWEGPCAPDQTAERMRAAAIYVLPSADEPYPMSVLEAMAVGLPVVVTDTCGLAGDITRIGCGIVVHAGELQPLLDAVRLLLGDEDLRAAMGRRGRAAARTAFGTVTVAHALEESYREAAPHVAR